MSSMLHEALHEFVSNGGKIPQNQALPLRCVNGCLQGNLRAAALKTGAIETQTSNPLYMWTQQDRSRTPSTPIWSGRLDL